MPIEYTLERKGTLVLANATGVLTVECFLSMQERMKADAGLHSPHSTLLDVRSATEIRIPEDGLNTIAANLSAGPRRLGAERLAIVATQEQVFALGRKYGELAKAVRENVIVFCQMTTARIWLGID